MPSSKFHLPMHPVEAALQPPDWFLWGNEILILSLAGNWTYVYIMYVKLGFKDKSYGMPVAPLVLNLGWEFVYGFLYPVGPAEIPWFILDCMIVWTTVKFGREEWRKSGNSPLVVDNFGKLMILGCIAAILFNWALVVACGSVDIAGYYSGFVSQAYLALGSWFHLPLRDHTKGHSMRIWIHRWIGSSSAMLLFWWRYYHYPESWPQVMDPLIIFSWIAFQVADMTYPFLFRYIRKRELAREAVAAAAVEGKKQ